LHSREMLLEIIPTLSYIRTSLAHFIS